MGYKKALTIFIITIACIATMLLLIIYFCGHAIPFWQMRYFELSQNSIEIQIVEESISRRNLLYFRLINNTNYMHTYGTQPRLYIRDGFRWRTVTIDGIGVSGLIIFDGMSAPLPPNSYIQSKISLSYFDFALPNGEYAIIKVAYHPDGTRLNVVGRFILRGE